MNKRSINVEGLKIDVFSLNTVIVGSGCAGFNAADSLYNLGQKDIAIVTEGINKGTSRNTGSDKQTYYKLTMAGGEADSVLDMAKTLFEGGCMHGDIALIEAALSSRCFYKLLELGVPFPYNKYGEFAGYKTDHDPRQRATSAGPLTSKYMTEKLEQCVKDKNIKIFDGYLVIAILTHNNKLANKSLANEKSAIGLIALNLNKIEDNNMGFTLFNCTNIIYAVGGPGGIYHTSVYPKSHLGSSGIAFEAGVKGVNLTEWQYGLASTKFRWNLSGTYQQVLPRYVSTKLDGTDENEFLNQYFPNPGKMLEAIFLKGYQWPFDPNKIHDYGSSLIDILVYNETQIKGRRVFLDYTKNPIEKNKNNGFDFTLLGKEAYEYLEKSNALLKTPVKRLEKMNKPALELYLENNIDLRKEYLEINVCAQHNNGGLVGNLWWESNVKHFFPVGEINGTFGIQRPGGSALNSTQVGSLRASQYIAVNYKTPPISVEQFVSNCEDQVIKKINFAKNIISNIKQPAFNFNSGDTSGTAVIEKRKELQKRMTKYGAHIRSYEQIRIGLNEIETELKNFINNTKILTLKDLPEVFRNWDIAISQYVYLKAMEEYIKKGGESRGSYLIQNSNGLLPITGLSDIFCFSLDNGELSSIVNEIELKIQNGNYNIVSNWNPVRPIPKSDTWFENVWKDYRDKFTTI